ncbi:hypothetical protein RhiirA1_470246 [Rhizophagus irregularis]|uniref:F-box domain-containing protein n=1 Tax=Rhizophagus irregularis TaxID=588596 RepID=A0A2N0R6I3_9GLOM|nr:hypothetical protein RhiirA1_470246 [Rhizophagus irregularis]GET64043.1 hypothetical protein GLOIN_2v1781695 [Rhizophagus irregularis DAOM 181602=DAOM 197198]
MACSKVLLGNFPELTDDIIQYFRDDISTLHSCILVNKFWCQIAIPLLWKDPFSIKNPKNFHFIEIYLQKINEKDKTQLNRCGINNDDEHDIFISGENRKLQIELMQLLFQKFGEYLENIGLKYKALEFINNYCKRIKFFDIHTSSIQKAHIALDSVKIFEQNLNYLSIYFYIPYDEKIESKIELFLRLAHILPYKLEYLNLSFSINVIKNVWEEFESYNIKVKEYNDLYIKAYEFIDEMY